MNSLKELNIFESLAVTGECTGIADLEDEERLLSTEKSFQSSSFHTVN
jgi:hypothetical protein